MKRRQISVSDFRCTDMKQGLFPAVDESMRGAVGYLWPRGVWSYRLIESVLEIYGWFVEKYRSKHKLQKSQLQEKAVNQ